MLEKSTWYFVQLDTFLISNVELRSKNVEVGIPVLTPILLLKDLGTLYLVLRTIKSNVLPLSLLGTSYIVLGTSYNLILF